MLHDVLFNVFPASRRRALVAVTVAVVGLSLSRADASFTFAPFDLTVSDSTAFVQLDTGWPPLQSFTTVTITADWSAVSGDPWSNQARAVLWKTPWFPPEVDYFTPIGPAYSGSAGNSSSTTLTWIGYLEGGGILTGDGSTLFFGAHQTSPGTTAQWNNITVTLSNLNLPPNSEVAVIGESVSFELTPRMVKWYKYTVETAGWHVFDTEGSNIFGQWPNDTAIGLFNADGQLVHFDDDSGPGFLSRMELFLTPGDYFLAAAGALAVFDHGRAFLVTTGSTATGTFVINSYALPVPEPTSAALLGLGLAALALLRPARWQPRHRRRQP